MRLSLPKVSSATRYFSFSLERVLGVVWWVLFGFGLTLLLLDCFLFYLYGLGYAKPSGVPDAQTIGVKAGTIRSTASLIEKTKQQFSAPREVASTTNPFR